MGAALVACMSAADVPPGAFGVGVLRRDGILIPFAFLGGLAGRPIGDRLGAEAFAMLAIALLGVAGAYTLGAAAVAFATT